MVNSISSYTSLTLSQKSLTNTTSLPKKKKTTTFLSFPFSSHIFLATNQNSHLNATKKKKKIQLKDTLKFIKKTMI